MPFSLLPVRTRSGAALLLASAALLVSACSSDNNAGPAPTAVAEPSAHPGPSPAATTAGPPPSIPLEAQGSDAVAALYAADYFFQAYNDAVRSYDTAAFENVSTPECGFCQETVSDLLAAKEEGQIWIGGIVNHERPVAPKDLAKPRKVTAFTNIVVEALEKRDRDGTIIESVDEERFAVKIDLVHLAGTWRVAALSTEETN